MVERWKAIEAFVPEEFWKLKVIHHIEDVRVEFSWKRVRLFNQLAVQVLLLDVFEVFLLSKCYFIRSIMIFVLAPQQLK